jgi:hypothetical protein
LMYCRHILQFMGHKFVAIFITPRTAVRCFHGAKRCCDSACARVGVGAFRVFLLWQQLFEPSPVLQLLKKGTTGLVVGSARANICLISGSTATQTLLNCVQQPQFMLSQCTALPLLGLRLILQWKR